MKKSITIASVEVILNFTFYTYKLLGDMWGKEGIQEVLDHIVKATTAVSEQNVKFEAMKVFSDMITVLDESGSLSEREIQNHFFEQPESLSKVVEAFVATIDVKAEEVDSKKKTQQT